ncbi:single-stranded DNA-binding protein [Tsukamurella paurometabola]|uniref:Helix-destabilizing protein n=1 Tax=Tsukamurella paurometabola TaxID=2061 RepID=A0A3P8LA91_TSUPA|nr:single-stranded DNA-binding protein [Tsukamurella paurometabola]UEA84341.1 single-stranded DNA-binding protein [Tsukamurella paurometabola]VDR41521.1 Helix-destabilizing protein [Tsukamurella paurometabola]
MPGVLVFAAGNVTNDLTYRESARDQRHDFLSFTMAANNGYLDDNGEWKQTSTVWLNVKAFGALARNARAVIAKGRPVIVHGELKHETFDGADGQRHSSLDLKADAIGLNLRMCASQYVGTGERYREITPPLETAAGGPAGTTAEAAAVGGATGGDDTGAPPARDGLVVVQDFADDGEDAGRAPAVVGGAPDF